MPVLTKEEVTKAYYNLSTSFELFCTYFLKHFITCEIPEFHKEIYSLLPKTQRLVLATPRGHGKSTICSIFYPLWLALFNKRKAITIISASETLAIDWLRAIKRELETNRKLLAFFGDLKSDKWTENHIILNNKERVNIRARGAQGQIRGFRPDCLICDDLETNETVESEEQRKKLKDWIFKDCLNTLLPEGQFIIIGTLIHPLSVLNDLLEIDNGWEKRKYQAYKEGKQEKGNELWEAMWSHEKLQARKKEIGSWAFACFTPETKVYTDIGLKRIDELKIRDKVFDRELKSISIKAIGSREVYQTYRIWLYGYDKPLECSNNHPFLVYEPQFYRNRYFCHNNISKAVTGGGNKATLEIVDTLTWKNAEKLVGNEYCVFPVNKNIIPSRESEFWWTVGRFLSEGNIYKNTIQICANKQEKHLLQRTLDYLNTTKWRGNRKIFDCETTYRIHIGNKELAEIFSKFGKKSTQKHLTQEAKNLDKDNFFALLDGYLSGDGYISKNLRMANSIDRQLLLDFKETLLKFGIVSCLNKIKDFHKEVIDGRLCNCHPLYHLAILENIKRFPKIYIHNNFQYSRIRKIEVVENKKVVFDIKTNGEFIVEGAVVHNSEYMNNPVSDETAPIKENQIRYWKDVPLQYSCVVSVDPAYSEDENADYKVASLIGIDQNCNRYLLSYVRTHEPIGDFQDAIINLWYQNKNTCTAIGIPNAGVEKSFFESFLKRCEERKIYPPVVEFKNSFTNSTTNISARNKKSRVIASLQPLFESGKYYIHPNHIEARDELLTIGSSRWDDIVDTLAYAEQILQPFNQEMIKEEETQIDRYGFPEEKSTVRDYGL